MLICKLILRLKPFILKEKLSLCYSIETIYRDCQKKIKWTLIQRWQCPIHNGLNHYLINIEEDVVVFLSLKVLNSDNSYVFLHYIYWSNKDFKGIVVNRALCLPRGSLEIMFTVHTVTASTVNIYKNMPACFYAFITFV